MNVFILVLLILLLILFLILITKLNIFVSYYHNGDDDELMIRVRAWRIISYTIKIPLIKIDKDSPSLIIEEQQELGGIEDEKKVKITYEKMMRYLEKLKDFLQHVVGFHKIIRRFLKHVSVQDMRWTTNIGVSDAAATGFLSGMVWSIKGGTVGLLSNYMKMKEMPKLSVNPHFQKTISQTDLKCIVSFRIGYSIIAGLLVLRHWKKRPTSLRTSEEKG